MLIWLRFDLTAPPLRFSKIALLPWPPPQPLKHHLATDPRRRF